jgi:hypothetical protein
VSQACRKCGSLLGDSDVFCGNCGQPVAADRTSATAVVPAQVIHDGPSARPSTTAVTTKPSGPDVAVRVAEAPPGADGEALAGEAQPQDRAAISSVDLASLTGEPTFDPLRNRRYLGQVARRFVLLALFAFLVEAVAFFFGLILSLIGGLVIAGFIEVVSAIVLGIVGLVFWLMPIAAMLAYDSKVISGAGPSAEQAFAIIGQALERHAIPRDSIQLRPLTLPGEGRRDFLELRYRTFAAYVSCFAHGRDLYTSWTFWVYMSPLRMIFMQIGRLIQSLQGKGNDLFQTLRYESVRAAAGVVHLCTVEGLELALSETAGRSVTLPDSSGVPFG